MDSLKINLSVEERDNLSLIVSQDASVIEGFCKQVYEYVTSGKKVNPKVYISAAKKLGIQPRQVSGALTALVSLLRRCTEASLSSPEVRDVLQGASLSAHCYQPILTLYETTQPHLKQCLQQQAVQVPTLCGLDWRVDVVAATRAAQGLAEPMVTLHLHTQPEPSGEGLETMEDGATSPLLLQTDATTLRHITATLEDALQHARGSHHARLHRALS